MPFIELNKNEAEEMLQKEMKVIDAEIENARNALRKAAKVWFSSFISTVSLRNLGHFCPNFPAFCVLTFK